MKYTKISEQVKSQLPEFVQNSYPTFIAFIEAYYEFMEGDGGSQKALDLIRSNQDIDTSLDEFARYLYGEYMAGFPIGLIKDHTNEANIMKKIKEFYLSKGTKKSYEFFFRILFGEEAQLYYPKKDVLRPSASNWSERHYIKVTFDGLLDDTVAGKKIVGQTSGNYGFIERISLENYMYQGENVYTVYVSNVSGPFAEFEQMEIDGVDGQIVIQNMITGVDVVSPGRNYTNEQPFEVGGIGTGADIYICDVSKGIVEDILILNSGYGYRVGDKLVIDPPTAAGKPAEAFISAVDDHGRIEKIKLVAKGYGYTQVPEIRVSSASSGTDAFLVCYSESIGVTKKIRIRNTGVGYDSTTSLYPVNDNGSGEFVPIIGNFMSEYYYSDKLGHLDDTKVIQDSYYWQDFSYEILVSVQIEKYRDYVKQLIHPAGLKMFGSYLLENNLIGEDAVKAIAVGDARATIDLIFDVFVQDAGYQSVDTYLEIIRSIISATPSEGVHLGPTYASLERLKFKYRPQELFQTRYPDVRRSRMGAIPPNAQTVVFSDVNQDTLNNKANTPIGGHIDPLFGMSPTRDCMLYDVINYPGMKTNIAPDIDMKIERQYRYNLKRNNVFVVNEGQTEV